MKIKTTPKNSVTVAVVEQLAEKMGEILEERIMKKLDEQYAAPVKQPESPLTMVYNSDQRIDLPSGECFSVPAHVGQEISDVMKQREANAYESGLKLGLVAGAIGVGYILFRQLFR